LLRSQILNHIWHQKDCW